VALKSDAAAEKSKDRLSRDFLGCSIFDFCNNICQKQTWNVADVIAKNKSRPKPASQFKLDDRG